MPVPNMSRNEKIIKIQREGGSGSVPGGSSQQQQETRSSWSSTYTTKSSSGSAPSSELYSKVDRRGSSPAGFNSGNNSGIKSSGLVSRAIQEFEDDVGKGANLGNGGERRNSSRTVTTTTTSSRCMPVSTPSMEIVPSGGGGGGDGGELWSMGTDAQGDVPLTYEVVTKADGRKEFQLLLTTRDFSPEDLTVKLTDNNLTISGNHEEKSPTGAFSSKSFYRTCTIPSGVRPEDLNCSLDSCGRLKITAPVPDMEKRRSSTKMITTTSSKDWFEDGNVPSGWKVGPGEGREQVISVFGKERGGGGDRRGSGEDQETGQSSSSRVKSVTTKTVKTYKSVS